MRETGSVDEEAFQELLFFAYSTDSPRRKFGTTLDLDVGIRSQLLADNGGGAQLSLVDWRCPGPTQGLTKVFKAQLSRLAQANGGIRVFWDSRW